MINNIIFFNWFHNGDLHVSRSFVREIVKFATKNKINCFYKHRNDPSLLSDIDGLQPFNQNLLLNEHVASHLENNNLFLNTWYGIEHYRIYNKLGLSYNCLYNLFEEHVTKYLNFSLKSISSDYTYFYPEIDYSKFYIAEVQKWLAIYKDYKKVLICNCISLSGQSINFNMDDIIYNLSNKYRGTLFITTNPTAVKNDNLFYSKDIIKKPAGSDLNENAFLSSNCEIVVGRLSGAQTYAYNKNNMFSGRKNIIISFTSVYNEALWYCPSDYALPYTCEIIHSNTNNTTEASNIVSNAVLKIFSKQ